jgi:predicted nucleic acid-binding protein
LVDAKRKGLITSFKKMALEMRENGIRFSLRLIEEIALELKEK